MVDKKRKRSRKNSKSASDETPETLDHQHPATSPAIANNPGVSVPAATAAAAAEPTVNTRAAASRRSRKKPKSSSPERRSSRLAELNGDCSAPVMIEDDERLEPPPPPMPSWETVARVVPAMDAVVKVFCVHTEPNFSLPWQRKRQYSSSSSGFIIGERRVLTNAHSVEHHTQVKVKKRGSDTKYLATVLAIGTECDIGKKKNISLFPHLRNGIHVVEEFLLSALLKRMTHCPVPRIAWFARSSPYLPPTCSSIPLIIIIKKPTWDRVAVVFYLVYTVSVPFSNAMKQQWEFYIRNGWICT